MFVSKLTHGLDRRAFLGGTAATLIASRGRSALGADMNQALAEKAYIWGYAPMVMRHTLAQSISLEAPFNRFFVVKGLPHAGDDMIAPNVDTLYGSTWLDLTREPVILSVPDTQGRYYCLQFIDLYTNTIAYVGSRATGTNAGLYALLPPGWSGTLPEGVVAIKASTSMVFVIARTLAADAGGLEKALGIQQQYRFCPLSSYPDGFTDPIPTDKTFINLPVDLASEGAAYFDHLCDVLVKYPPFGTDVPRLAEFAEIGIVPGATPSRNPALHDLFERAIPPAERRIRSFAGEPGRNGWSGTYGITAVIDDIFMRAVLNARAPGVQVSEEAIYFSRTKDQQDRPLDGRSPAVLHFPNGQLPPVNAFWSMSLLDADGWKLTENPIDRYAIGDQTSGLRYGEDGSLTIHIQASRPSDTANWLPAPQGPYQLILRTYAPKPAIINQEYVLPPVLVQ